MVRKSTFLALFLMLGAAFMSSCQKEELSSKKEILAFIFDASKNAQLERNYIGDIEGTNILTEVSFGVNTSQLIPTIEISPRATISPEPGNITDFTGPVIYTVTAEDGSTKTFTVNIAVASAPYIGSWTSAPIDFGSGLMRINAEITAEGLVTLEFKQILTGQNDPMSMKGYFEPNNRQDIDIYLVQTHRWTINGWVPDNYDRSFMYHVNNAQSMRLYYCLNFPRVEWCFQINMTRL